MGPEQLERLQAALAERYAIERELGRGGMATVYLVEDRKHQRRVALKVLHPELAASLGAARFLREITTAARLTHPHILPLLDSGEAGEFLYYVMPYVEGESLRDRLAREKQLPLDDALLIAREVADALSFAHSRGIVHRDIKPENILLEVGHAVVTDFGIARALGAAGGERFTETGLTVGTPSYMSPEQSTGAQDLDGRSDVYSLACVLYEMLGGEPPYTGPTPQAVIAKRLSEPVPHITTLRETVPPALEAVITRSLAKAPADRFATAHQFVEALHRAASSEAPVAHSPRRRRWRWVAAGVTTLVVLLVGAAYALVPSGARTRLLTLLTRGSPTLDPRRIVVAPLDNRTGDEGFDALGEMAADWVATALLETGEFEVVDPRTALVTARIVERIPTVLRNADRAIAIAEETGAGAVLSGDIYRSGDSLRMQIRVTEAATGRLVHTPGALSGPVRESSLLIASVGRLALAALAVAADTTAIGSMTGQPPSYAAYQEIRQGLERYLRQDYEAFFAHADRAVAIDTGYLAPLVLKAYVLMDVRRWAQGDSLVRALERRQDRLTRGERLLLRALRADLEGDLDGRVRISQEVLRYSPASAEAAIITARAAVRVNRPHDALEALAQTDPRRGINLVAHPYWAYRAAALHEMEDHTPELDAAEQGVRRFPHTMHMRLFRTRSLAALGRVSVLETELAQRPRFPPPSEYEEKNPLTVERYHDLSAIRELRTHGHESAARQFAATVLADVRSDQLDTARAIAHFVHGALLYEAERWEEAREVFSRLATEESGTSDRFGFAIGLASRGYLGTIAARLGARALAHRIASDLEVEQGPWLFGRQTFGRARIAAVLGDSAGAVRLLQRAFAEGQPYNHAEASHEPVHSHPDFIGLRDYPPFRQLMTPRN